MGLGVIASAFSFVKLGPIDELVKHTPTDPTWSVAIVVIWGQVELWIVLIALSIPPIWPLVKPFFHEVSTRLGTKGRTGRSGLSDNSRDYKLMDKGSVPYNMHSLSSKAARDGKMYKSNVHKGGISRTTDVTITSESQSDLFVPPGRH